jgi:hypothetical protein
VRAAPCFAYPRRSCRDDRRPPVLQRRRPAEVVGDDVSMEGRADAVAGVENFGTAIGICVKRMPGARQVGELRGNSIAQSTNTGHLVRTAWSIIASWCLESSANSSSDNRSR